MPSKELGVVFDPEIHGPGQMRFGFNGSRTLEVIKTISVLNLYLHQTGIFPDLTPEDLPNPEIEFSGKFLGIIQSLDELGCIKFNGEYNDRSDDDDVKIKGTVLDLNHRMKALFVPLAEDSPPETGLLKLLRETRLVSKIIGRVDPPKTKHYPNLNKTPVLQIT